jgi:hypothetical protein
MPVILSRTAECRCGARMANGTDLRKSLRCIGESPEEYQPYIGS